MTVHLSVRLPWHDSGWNGCICQHPKRNVYCGGLFSVNAELIRQNKDDVCTDDNAGKPVSLLDKLPPCAQHINTFGDQVFTFEHQPRDFLKAKGPYAEEFTANCFGTWPYDSMYDPEAGRREAEVAERRVREQFDNLEKDRSLIFFYLNYSNPLCPEIRKYVLAGVSRYRDKGDLMRWSGMPQDRIEKYGDLVWSRLLRHDGSDECFVIPYHEYLKQGLDVSKILLAIEGPLARRFKYVSRPLSDGDAKEMIGGMLQIAKHLKADGIVQDNWDLRLEWLDKRLDECWHQRGLFPGLAGVLGFLRFDNATDFAHNVLTNVEDPRKYVFDRLEGQQEPEPEYLQAFQRASKRWNARPQIQKEILKEHLCLFELTTEQIEHVLSDDRENYSITSSLEEILDNPYIITEEYNSGKADDIIALHQIDQGMMPSTKLEAPWRINPNDPRRIRAALTEILKQAAESGHSFLPTNEAIRLLDNRGEEWRNLMVDTYDIKAEIEHYEKRICLEEDGGLSRLALKEIREHELKIRETVEELLSRAKREGSGLDWNEIVRTRLSVEPDDDAVREQVASLEPAYCNSFFVLTGAAGTGKTTMLNALIQGIKQKESESAFLLLAPTGKAALRLFQKTQVKAYTIDSILWQYGWGNEITESLITEGGNLISNCKNVIIDESSMVDVEKLGILFRAIPWSNIRRLIMVGDPNQLPPIGVGKPFADIIEYIDEHETFKDNLGQLRVNCRIHQQKDGSAMLQLASGYTRFGEDIGSEEILSNISNGENIGDIYIEFWNDEDDLPMVLDKALRDSLGQYAVDVNTKPLYETFNSVLGLDNNNVEKLDTLQVLGPVRGEFFGIDAINFRLQKMLRRYYLQRWNYHLGNFARYDKVIHIKNKRICAKWHEARDIDKKEWIRSYVPNGALGAI